MIRATMLGLILLCGVYSPNPRELQFAEELQRARVKVVAGPWDINDPKSLMDPETGMCSYRALWGWGFDKDGNLLDGCDKDGKWLWGHDKDGKALWEWNGNENCFTFNTIGEVRALEQKLRSGKGLRMHIIFYKDLSQLWKSGTKAPSFLCLDPQGFFFSVDYQKCPSSFWTLRKDFFEASKSPEKMVEFQKQLDISEQEKQEWIKTPIEEKEREISHKKEGQAIGEEFEQEQAKILQNIRELQQKLSASERTRQEEHKTNKELLENIRKEFEHREQTARKEVGLCLEAEQKKQNEFTKEQISLMREELQEKLTTLEREKQEQIAMFENMLKDLKEESARREQVMQKEAMLYKMHVWDQIQVLQKKNRSILDEAKQEQVRVTEDILKEMEEMRKEIASRDQLTRQEFKQEQEKILENVCELQAKLEVLELEKQVITEATIKREEEMLKKMDDMRKMIEEGLRTMMESFLQQNFVRSPDANSSASAAAVRVAPAPRAIMDRIIEENSEPQNFDKQMQEIHENLDRAMYQLKCIFAPTPPASEAPAVEAEHEVVSDWSRRLEEVATPPETEPKSPSSAAAAGSEVPSSDLSHWSVVGPGGGTIERHK